MAISLPSLSALTAEDVSPVRPITTTSFVTWDEAVQEFLLHKQAAYSPNTVYYFEMLLRPLVRWALQEGVAFPDFGKRHMDRYTAAIGSNVVNIGAIPTLSPFVNAV